MKRIALALLLAVLISGASVEISRHFMEPRTIVKTVNLPAKIVTLAPMEPTITAPGNNQTKMQVGYIYWIEQHEDWIEVLSRPTP